MIDIDQVRRLDLHDGAVFTVPADTSFEAAQQLGEAIHLVSGANCLVIIGELKDVSCSQMNAAGWYRA